MSNDVDLLNNYQDPLNGMGSLQYKNAMYDCMVEWLIKFQDWKHFITLTFDDKLHPGGVSQDNADKAWRSLVRSLNIGTFGKNYTHIVKHSYFGYVKSSEYQKREVIHFHVLATNKINYELIHRLWSRYNGFAWIEGIKNIEGSIRYITKYLLKDGGMLELWKPKKPDFLPNYLPIWWNSTDCGRGFIK